MSDAHVRTMTEADLTAVAEIERQGFGGRSTAMTEADLREELVRPWARTWVAEKELRVAGFLLAWHIVDEIHVLNVAVLTAQRRQGIARALMAQLFAYARERSVASMYLEVRLGNQPAIELYRVHGFRRFNVRRSYYSDGEDALEMRLDFDAKGGVVLKPDEV